VTKGGFESKRFSFLPRHCAKKNLQPVCFFIQIATPFPLSGIRIRRILPLIESAGEVVQEAMEQFL
jgi:hypothetical protein